MVSIILINYNNSFDTIECVKSLNELDYSDVSIIVVDNGSSTENKLKLNELPTCKYKMDVLFLDKNLGFAGGNNKGIEYALTKYNPDYFLLLNNDTLVEKNLISVLLNSLGDNYMSTPKVLFESNRNLIWANGGYFNYKRGTGMNRDFKKKDNNKRKKEIVEFAPFCAVLFKKELLDIVGYMSEEYFMYYEDADYCMRMKEKGCKIIYTPETIVYHKVSASTGGLRSPFYTEWMTRSYRKFVYKFFNKKRTIVRMKIRNFEKLLYYRITRNSKNYEALKKGLKK